MSDWLPIPPERLQLFMELFSRVGYRSPSMLDMANHLGISKKTLYTYVPNKQELILLCLIEQEKKYTAKHQLIVEKNFDQKDELWELFGLVWQFYQEFSYLSFQDVAQHYPLANEKLKELEQLVCHMLQSHLSEKKYNQSPSALYITKLVCHQIKQIAHREFRINGKSQANMLEDLFQYNWRAITAKS